MTAPNHSVYRQNWPRLLWMTILISFFSLMAVIVINGRLENRLKDGWIFLAGLVAGLLVCCLYLLYDRIVKRTVVSIRADEEGLHFHGGTIRWSQVRRVSERATVMDQGLKIPVKDIFEINVSTHNVSRGCLYIVYNLGKETLTQIRVPSYAKGYQGFRLYLRRAPAALVELEKFQTGGE